MLSREWLPLDPPRSGARLATCHFLGRRNLWWCSNDAVDGGDRAKLHHHAGEEAASSQVSIALTIEYKLVYPSVHTVHLTDLEVDCAASKRQHTARTAFVTRICRRGVVCGIRERTK